MDEDVQMSARTGAWIVEKPRAAPLEAADGRSQIGNFDCYVMQSFASFVNELRDHGVWSGGFEQLDARAAGGKHRDLDVFVFDGFAQRDGEAELLFVEGERVVERPNRDAQVINVKFL